QVVSLARIVRVLPDDCCQLFHAGGRLLQRGRLLLRPARKVRITGRDFVRAEIDLIYAGTDNADGLLQIGLRTAQIIVKRVDLVTTTRRNSRELVGQVALAEFLQPLHDVAHRPKGAPSQPADDQRDEAEVRTAS